MRWLKCLARVLFAALLANSVTVAWSQSLPAASASAPSMFQLCPNLREAFAGEGFPRSAVRRKLAFGEVLVGFTLTADDRMIDITVVEASDPVFAEAAVSVVRKLRCKSGGQEMRLRIPFTYRYEGRSS
jgi:protein TonB